MSGAVMEHAQLEAAFAAAGLARLVPALDRLVRPSIRLRTTRAEESRLSVGASQLGGLPDLPEGVAWPEWHGLPQSFLLQLRLADMQPLLLGALAGALPAQGMLWF